MPLASVNASPVIGVWKITESWHEMLDCFKNKALFADEVLKIQSDSRKCEWLAVRLLVKQLTGTETLVFYKENGAPFLADNRYHISISHTRGYAAIILSRTPQPGIDIEYRSERAWKLRTKYLNTQESKLCDPTDCYTVATLCWCAKETAYKALQETAIDFIKHLHIEPFTLSSNGIIFLKELKTDKRETFRIHYRQTDDYIITWKE